MKKKLTVVVSIIIFKKKYLLQLRDDKKKIKERGVWGLFGGHCQKNEKIENCLLRELNEEISVKFKKKTFLFNFFEKQYNANVNVFKTNLNDKKRIKLNEGKDFAFFSKKEILKTDNKISKITLKIFKRYFKN